MREAGDSISSNIPQQYTTVQAPVKKEPVFNLPHPLYPPLLPGEGEEKKRGAKPLLDTPSALLAVGKVSIRFHSGYIGDKLVSDKVYLPNVDEYYIINLNSLSELVGEFLT